MMNYKKAFYSKLEDCYLGAKIKVFHKDNIAKAVFPMQHNLKELYNAESIAH